MEIPIGDPKALFEILREQEIILGCKYDVLAFDEIQFFSANSGFYQIIDALLGRGYYIIAAGLALDFKCEPFGSTLLLVGLCQNGNNIMWLTSFCAKCGEPAPLPQRIIDGNPAPYNSPQILVGGKEAYEARCYDCFELPGRPNFQF